MLLTSTDINYALESLYFLVVVNYAYCTVPGSEVRRKCAKFTACHK